MNNDISQLSIRKLLSGESNYTIPMYQRNYAWDEGEITQLIQDVIDYLPERRNYYIGTLVVFERTDGRRSVYETSVHDKNESLVFQSYLENHYFRILLVETNSVGRAYKECPQLQ